MMDKKTLRKEKLKKRDSMPPDLHKAFSEQIVCSLTEQREIAEEDDILCYVRCRSEADTIPFIEACLENGKRVFCPRVNGETDMDFYQIVSLADLKHGSYGILEPEAEEERRYRGRNGGCIIVPGAVFDGDGNRIGYGKGYYDRYLEKHPWLKTIGICFSCQMACRIPAEKTDIRMDKIITENEVYSIV